MRLVSINSELVGKTVSKPIYDSKGLLLLNAGTVLSSLLVEKLQATGITFLYVDSSDALPSYPSFSIPEEEKYKILDKMRLSMEKIVDGNHDISSITHLEIIEELTYVFSRILDILNNNDNVADLFLTLQYHNHEVFLHSLNVTFYSIAIGKAMQFDNEELYEIGLGAMLHDIGKLILPATLLEKTGKLTEEEFNEIKRHPVIAYEILSKMKDLPESVVLCAYQHHEKLDGTGYPNKISADKIHLYAQVLAVADIYDALTSHRSYRDAMLPSEALEVLMASAMNQINPFIVNIFKSSIAIYPIGLTVQTSSGITGIVHKILPGIPHRPIIKVIKDDKGDDIVPYILDLTKQLNITITGCDTLVSENLWKHLIA
ncbi:HD-GYP domain-containing protein [Bacillus sp. HMF5848]|uniref:HD-GYP domain-containing protein n=1 Tax=Bacillus sp. HMF5848 TaxID=2495421 RepID=UPI000F793A1D|nr:HD-GYP domain-containing protein [Bacillus sp. HMF5848]RSK27159.1 HD-GYP domain-containing protein [Bacillus sp. HMF5848]